MWWRDIAIVKNIYQKKKKSIKKQENFTIDIVQTAVLIPIVKFLFPTAVASGWSNPKREFNIWPEVNKNLEIWITKGNELKQKYLEKQVTRN